MARVFVAPDSKEVAHMLTWLFGREVKVGTGSRLSTGARDRYTLSTYVDEKGRAVALAAMDLPLTAGLGGALSLFPPHQLKPMIEAGKFDAGVWANTREVYNVLSKYFHEAYEGMVQVGETYEDPESIPLDVKRMIRAVNKRADYRIEVPGYPPGIVALLAT